MTTTLTKAELSDLLFEKVGLNKREAKDMVEAFFEEIRLNITVVAHPDLNTTFPANGSQAVHAQAVELVCISQPWIL